MVKTITLTAGTPQAVTFSEAYPFYWIDNKTSGEVYASVGSTPEPGKDGTYTIAAGSQLRISGGDFNGGIVLLGEGRVQVVASGIAACPFKSAPVSGGGEGVKEVSGASSYTVDAVDYPIIGLNMYGKSTQGGVPTPENPVEIVSVGDSGSVEISADNGEKSTAATITSALPLCGIPVASGGNYTDITGQQWVCDELIYNADGTGKIIKNIRKYTFTGTDDGTWNLHTTKDSTKKRFAFIFSNETAKPIYDSTFVSYSQSRIICDRYSSVTASNTYNLIDGICVEHITSCIYIYDESYNTYTLDEWKSYLTSNPITVVYQLNTPQEIELTAAEMTALRQLQTFDGVTNIFNNGGADMDVKFCTNKALSEYVLPITNGLQAQIDELRAAVLSLGGNV